MATIKHQALLPEENGVRCHDNIRLESTTTHLILLEGLTELRILNQLLKPISQPENCVIQALVCGGDIPCKKTFIEEFFKSNESTALIRIAVVSDADNKQSLEVRCKEIVDFANETFGIWMPEPADRICEHYEPEQPVKKISYFLTPAVVNEGMLQFRQGTIEHYFLEHYQQELFINQGLLEFKRSVFDTDWFASHRDILALGNHQAKWLSAAFLLSMADESRLNKSFTEIGLSCERGSLKLTDWENLNALRDYLAAFLG